MAEPAPAALARQEPRALGVLSLVAVAAWAFLVWAVVDMRSPLAMLMMPMEPDWSASNFVAVLVMWSVMMVAMMLPAAAPMVLTFTSLSRRRQRPRLAAVFVAAYVVVWAAFSAAATASQWGLQWGGLISPMMASRSALLTAVLLLVAGVVQFTPLKDVCLRHCRTPMGFLLTEWRDGPAGAWRMGVRHGLLCLGCCWALMGLLFVAGVMNLAWVAAITAAVFLEKVHPAGVAVARLLGAGLIVAGVVKFAGLGVA